MGIGDIASEAGGHEAYLLSDPTSSSANNGANREGADAGTRSGRCTGACFAKFFGVFLVGALSGIGAAVLVVDRLESNVAPYAPASGGNSSYGCSRSRDVEILLDLGSTFMERAKGCNKAKRKTGVPLVPCLEQSTNVTESCAQAYTNFEVCGEANCAFICILHKGQPQCTSCICSHCRKQLLDDVKIPCTLMPEGPHNCNDCPGHTPADVPPTPAPSPSS